MRPLIVALALLSASPAAAQIQPGPNNIRGMMFTWSPRAGYFGPPVPIIRVPLFRVPPAVFLSPPPGPVTNVTRPPREPPADFDRAIIERAPPAARPRTRPPNARPPLPGPFEREPDDSGQ